MNMKRFAAVLISSIFVFAFAACGNNAVVQDDPNQAPPATQDTTSTTPATTDSGTQTAAEPDGGLLTTQAEILASIPDITPSGTIILGSTTVPSMDFIDGWTNPTPNAQAKRMMGLQTSGGYMSTTAPNPNAEILINPVVVKEYEKIENSDGTATFNITIHDNLKFSDGSPISAQDYVFWYLFNASPLLSEAGSTNVIQGTNSVGWNAYNSGETKEFAGMHLYDDFSFGTTIAAENLPMFFESTYYTFVPLPMATIAPGVTMHDDGNGAYLSDNFTMEMLNETVFSPNGYRYRPNPVAGAYMFGNYDDNANTIVLTANPHFLGTFDGYKPRIETVVFRRVTSATAIDELATGGVDVLGGSRGAEVIDPGLDLIDSNPGFRAIPYFRAGFGIVRFHVDFGPTQFVEVRQAMIHLIDRDEFVRQFSGGHAIVVNSRYSQNQWMYQEAGHELESRLTHYTYNPARAVEILVEGGWTLNESGGDFVEGVDALRHKEVDGELMPLVINWASSQPDAVSDLLAIMLPPEAERAGMRIDQSIYDSVLDLAARRGVVEPHYHMFNQGLNWAIPDTIWNAYNRDPRYFGAGQNGNWIADDELYEITQAMKNTPANDRETFLSLWLDAMERWNYLVPDIPLYADTDYDFFIDSLQNYFPDSTWDFSQSIPRAYLE